MKHGRHLLPLLGCLLSMQIVAACASPAPDVASPPASLSVDRFYSKYVDADGIPVLSSAKVPDRALLVARQIVQGMLDHRPDLAQGLAASGYRVAIMAEDESTLDLPEQRDWKKPDRNDPRLTRCELKHYDERIGRMTDRAYWNYRARGMAGKLTSGAVEDLLGQRNSRYYGQTIFLHEFSHDILQAIRAMDPRLYKEVQRAYESALRADRWRGEYASTTIDEYWAVGSQFWFNSGRLVIFDGRRILSDADLKAYDPALYAVLGKAYGTTHRIEGDPFYMSEARIPPGPLPANTAEVC